MSFRPTCGSMFLVLLLGLCASCGRHMYGRPELEEALSRHHLDLRWGRVANAATKVHADMRQAFMLEWTRRQQELDLQDLEVASLVVDDAGDNADVTVSVTWVDRASQQAHSATLLERWIRDEQGWHALQFLEIAHP